MNKQIAMFFIFLLQNQNDEKLVFHQESGQTSSKTTSRNGERKGTAWTDIEKLLHLVEELVEHCEN